MVVRLYVSKEPHMKNVLIIILVVVGLFLAYKVATYDFCPHYYGTTCLVK